MKEKYHELDTIARKLTISYSIYLVSLIIYPVSQVLVIRSGIGLVVRGGLHLWYLISYLALCLYVYKGQNVLSQKGASKRSGKVMLTVSLVVLILSEFPLGFQVLRLSSSLMILLMGMRTVCWYAPPVIGIFAPLIVMSDFKKLKKTSGNVAGSFAMNETGYLECVGKAVASFLSTSVFLGVILMMFIADSYSDDSRAGFVFPVIIPLLLIGVIYGIRAWSDLRTLHKNTPHHLPRSALFVIGGLLIPFFVGILLAARFLLLLIWSFSSLQSPQHLQQSTAADSLNQGFRWYQKGNYDRAIKAYTAAIKTNPHSPDAFYGRGLSWDQKGNYDQAINDYTEVIKIDPHSPDAFYNRRASWDQKGDYEQAINDYTAAIARNPRAYAYNNLSWLLATCPIAQYRNGVNAIELAKRAIELRPQIMYYWDTLAAAYAEIGDFTNAITPQENVIHSLKKEGLKKEGFEKTGTEEEFSAYLVEVAKHLDAYKKHEPWREVRVSTKQKKR